MRPEGFPAGIQPKEQSSGAWNKKLNESRDTGKVVSFYKPLGVLYQSCNFDVFIC